MSEPLLFVGIGCIIAAIVGGGLSLANLKVPVVNSVPRQLILAATGLVIVGGSFLLPGKGEPSTGGNTGGDGTGGTIAEITLSDSSAARGSPITVTGSGFEPGELVEIRVHVTTVGTVTADSNGSFRQRVTVPDAAPPPGFPTSVAATGHSSVKTATAPFTTR